MRPSLLELQVLVALDDQKTLTQIGQELFLKHPTISRALHSAEQKAGVSLAEHVGRRLRLTTAGVELAADAREVLARYDDLDRMLEDLRTGEAGSVRVVATRTACSYILPPVLERFLSAYTQATISLHVATPSEVWQRFIDERHDLAVAPRTGALPPDAEWLFDEEDALYVHPADPLVRTDHHAPMHIPTLIAPIAREPERHVDEQLRRNHISFGRRLDIRNLETAKQLVEAGVGAGLFSRSTAAREVNEGRMVELSWLSLDVTTSWYLAQRAARRQSALVERLVGLLNDLYVPRTHRV
jgi:LysR family transcriptional regulator, low CO2-responsive transcriptional regulator